MARSWQSEGIFKSPFKKALRGLEIGIDGLTNSDLFNKKNKDYLKNQLRTPAPDRILYLAEAIRQGFNLNEIYDLTHIDLWFLSQIEDLVREELSLKNKNIDKLSMSILTKLKGKVSQILFYLDSLNVLRTGLEKLELKIIFYQCSSVLMHVRLNLRQPRHICILHMMMNVRLIQQIIKKDYDFGWRTKQDRPGYRV